MKTVLTIVFSLTVSAQSLSNEGWDFFDTDTQEFILDSVYDVQRIYFIEALELDPFQHNAQVDVNGDGIEVPPQMVKKFFSLLIEHRELFEHLKADAFHFFMKKMLPGSSDSQISVLL